MYLKKAGKRKRKSHSLKTYKYKTLNILHVTGKSGYVQNETKKQETRVFICTSSEEIKIHILNMYTRNSANRQNPFPSPNYSFTTTSEGND